ncbi:glycosyltransferase [Flavobacterium sp. JP2137]|uniref:glycosyltransferase n=1 Tax=Flavobacterium sp. JP2137 TaxID=3414510 RepID=UPI003D30093B
MSLIQTKSICIFTLNLGAGGAEKTISLLLPELVKDYKVYLVIFQRDLYFTIPEEVNLVVFDNNKNRFFSFFYILYKYCRFLKRNKIEVSLSFLTRPNLINGIIKVLNKKIKVIVSERCFPSKAYKSHILRYTLYKILIPLLYNRADYVFSNSHYINDDLKSNFGVIRPMFVIYNPIKEVPSELYTSTAYNEVFTIAWVGKLVKIKNPKLLIDSLKDINIEYNAFFLGEGVLKKSLVNEVVNDNIEFYGVVKDVNKYLKRADCFVLSSNSEGFPNVVLEAMACGLPVIATNCISGPLEILNDNDNVEIDKGEYFIAKYGILINVGDVSGLSKALLKLFSDKELRENLAKASLQRVKHYSVEAIYKEIKILIND